jgi:hypothetical protein
LNRPSGLLGDVAVAKYTNIMYGYVIHTYIRKNAYTVFPEPAARFDNRKPFTKQNHLANPG